MQERIIELIKKAVGEMGISEQEMPVFALEHPDEMKNGDFATNISLVLSKSLKKSPVAVAGQIAEKLRQNKIAEIEKIEVAGPGFINFYLSPNYFNKEVKEILNKKERYGQNNSLHNQKTTVEYTDPNPFKEFHIGHLMTNIIGETLACLEEANGAPVTRACYQGDVGLHVAKAIWGAKKMMQEDLSKRKTFLGNFFGAGRDPKIWGQAYAFGATKYEEDETAKKEIIVLNKVIYERTDREVNKIYDIGRKVSLQEFERLYKVLGTHFDKYFFESEMADLGKDLVEKNISTGVFELSDGAVVFRGEKYDLHTRVFINGEGLPTYEAKELALAKIKFDQTGYDKSIVVTGNEINDYYKVVMKVLDLIYPELAKKVEHIGHGMLRLPSGKMSSRTGKVISGEFLLNEIKNLVLDKMKDREFTAKEKENIAEIISIGAIKYSILKQAAGSDIIFDFDKSLSFEGDSGPYLQYSYVRAKSILEKAGKEGIKANINLENNLGNIPLSKMLIRFPEIVARAGKEYSPHYLATYLTELASTFSTFYANEVVVDKNDPDSPYKVALTEAFSIVMKNGLKLLGIRVPEKM
jgi:arginyl-tRNA synthetase